MIIEDVAWAQLDPLVLPDFDQYWRITLDFLNIAITEWPKILAERDLVDAARRQVLLVDAQIAQIRAGRTKGPIIAIGSTGTNRATARLLAALAAAPNGAVVLPGLDQNLDETAWRQIGATDVGDPGFGHPQAALRRLLSILEVPRAEVTELGAPTPLRATRSRIVSEALRPADTTEEWTRFRASPAFSQIAVALQGVSLIEAADEREEALALAIVLREMLETPGATAALVTPDRDMARRVGAELTRFGIEIDDSAGEPLNASATGSLALRAIDAAVRGEGADLVAPPRPSDDTARTLARRNSRTRAAVRDRRAPAGAPCRDVSDASSGHRGLSRGGTRPPSRIRRKRRSTTRIGRKSPICLTGSRQHLRHSRPWQARKICRHGSARTAPRLPPSPMKTACGATMPSRSKIFSTN